MAMLNTEKITIITPSFRSRDTIQDTFNSVINQTNKNWEWIIVDDCSDDGSFDFIKELIKNEKRILLFQTEENSGSATARNLGLQFSSGRYITFLDSDDTIDSDYLEKQLEFIRENGPIVSAGYRRMAKKTCTDFYVPKDVDYKLILKGNPLSCLTTMYDKNVVGERFFPNKLEKCEDFVFWLNILKDGFIAHGNPNVLATYRIRPGSKSSNKLHLIKYMYRVYHKTQNLNFFKSWFYVICWMFYGLRKYKGVR